MSTYRYNDYRCEGSLALKPERNFNLRLVGGCNNSLGSACDATASRFFVSSRSCSDDARRSTLGRRLATCLALVLFLFAIVGLGLDLKGSSIAREALSNQQPGVITVGAGETLWGIAEAHSVDGASTNDVVTWIRDQNHLSSSSIQAGQSLIVPSGLMS
ncbi:MAG: LysM peptidoglycan-binding domain-containing protein [Olsenella sp.]|nr:LysM peptidoglycan-binding domain-containing protein [Olsenella sp.]